MGDHVTIMQHVTLGGTGNDSCDRHPKIGNHVQIGVKATILGGILTVSYSLLPTAELSNLAGCHPCMIALMASFVLGPAAGCASQ